MNPRTLIKLRKVRQQLGDHELVGAAALSRLLREALDALINDQALLVRTDSGGCLCLHAVEPADLPTGERS